MLNLYQQLFPISYLPLSSKKYIRIMTTWKIDNMHSEVGFKVRHMMISNVSGNFASFDATLNSADDNLADASFDFSAAIDSIQTGVADRDGHLKSGDFFDAAAYPTLSFKSTEVIQHGGEWQIKGDMTIKGVSHPITLNAEFAGVAVDPYGQTKAGLTITGKIKRSDFGLTWSAVTEAGNVVLGDEITLISEAQFVKQA
jgi:polyisoprenoid-binding protein YceI